MVRFLYRKKKSNKGDKDLSQNLILVRELKLLKLKAKKKWRFENTKKKWRFEGTFQIQHKTTNDKICSVDIYT